jgi:hypothetical protein
MWDALLVSQPDPATHGLIAESRDLWRESWISARAHRAAAEAWGWAYYFIGVPAALAAAAAGLSVIAELSKWVAATLAIVSAALTGLMTFLRPGDESLNHRNASAGFRVLQENLRTFRTVDASSGLPYADLRLKFDELLRSWSDLEEAGPHVRERTYRRASAEVAGRLKPVGSKDAERDPD